MREEGTMKHLSALRVDVGLALMMLALAVPASASVIPSKADDAPSAGRARTLEQAREFLARDQVAQALSAHGLSPADVDQRLGRLSDRDLQLLAAHIDQVQAAGDVPKYIWILLAIFLAVSILVLVF
jgi:hypothetical protein